MRNFVMLVMLIAICSCKTDVDKRQLYADADTSSNEVVQLTDKDDYYYTLEDLIDQQSGNVVYIHFWNAYSGNIIDRLKAIDTLNASVDSDKFTVIHISTDKNNAYWNSFSTQMELENSYIARNYPDASFYKEVQLYEAPRFMIYATDGTLIDDRAVGPDNPQLSVAIKQLIP